MGDEAERLEDMSDGGAADYIRYQEELEYGRHINNMEKRYRDNLRADIGTTIRCACCAKRIIKKAKLHQFCSNKGKGNCKDTYWNNVNDNRRERAHRYS